MQDEPLWHGLMAGVERVVWLVRLKLYPKRNFVN